MTTKPTHSRSAKITVLLVDDQPAILAEMKNIVDNTGIAEVIGTETNGPAALLSAAETLPDLVMLDVSLSEMNGFDIARRLVKTRQEVRILAISAYDDDLYVRGMLAAGARGYLLKEHVSNEIKNAIITTMAGGRWIGRGLTCPPGMAEAPDSAD